MSYFKTTYSKHKFYPLMLDIKNQLVAVVGGGEVASRKTRGLLKCGAKIRLISPDICQDMQSIISNTSVIYINRPYRYGDLSGACMAIAATSDPTCQKEIYKEAKELNILINVVDNPNLCNFIVPSSIQCGDLQIAISTHGQSPAIAKMIRKQLEKELLPSYAIMLELAGELRYRTKQVYSGEQRTKILKKLADPRVLVWIENKDWARIKKWAITLMGEGESAWIEKFMQELIKNTDNSTNNI